MKIFHFALCLATCLWSARVFGAVTYDADLNTIIVRDFPEAYPARLQTLVRADLANSWNKVEYNAPSQTYTVTANLQVGQNDDSETWMQVGSAGQTNETLIIDGNLILAPYLVVGENPAYTSPRRVNRLTLGVQTNPAIRATLKIAGVGHTIYSGKLPGSGGILRNGYGGELHIYHGMLTSASGRREIARPYWSGFLMLDHAVVSKFNAVALFGAAWGAKVSRTDIRDSIFEDNRGVFCSPSQQATGCLFRNNTTVIQGLAGDTVRLIGCVFESNACNWQLDSGGTIECLDCVITPGANPDTYGFKGDQPARAIMRRHVIIKVEDADGAPVAQANVVVTGRPADGDLVFNNYAVTGPDGCTPGKGDSHAMLLTEAINAPAKTEAFKTTRYDYAIEVTAKGRAAGHVGGFVPRQNWETITVALPKAVIAK